jgi:steroid delta-isomerase-like uncharacterized protein
MIFRSTEEGTMDHAGTMRRAYELINAGNLDAFVDMLSDDFVEHEELPGVPPTKEGVRQFFAMYLTAFPDLRMNVEDMIASGDKVATRLRITGTHQGEFMGVPATGKPVDYEAIDIVRFGDDGVPLEHWGVTDAMRMMAQVGAIPEGPPG